MTVYDDPIAAFDDAVREHSEKHNRGRFESVLAIARKNPKLHREYLLATNPTARARRQLKEKFDLE